MVGQQFKADIFASVRLLRGAMVGGLVVGGLLLPACGNPQAVTPTEEESSYETEVAEQPEVLEDAAIDPESYLEKPLTINGEVEAVFGTNAYLVREEEYFNNDFGLLVVSPDESLPLPEVGQMVTIEGELRQFVVTEPEAGSEIIWDAEALANVEAAYQEGYVFVARSVTTPLDAAPSAVDGDKAGQ
jgi:hypothetical protein